jgi:hypothetical protein
VASDSATSDEFFFEPELVVRGSTGPASVAAMRD